jgi:Flp pilus assembly protein TadD
MGGAYTAVTDDATSVWWNPAGLAKLKALNAVAAYASIGEGIGLSHLSGALPIGRGVAGLSLTSYSFGSYEVRDESGVKTRDASATDIGAAFGYGFVNPTWLGGRGWGGLSLECVSQAAGGTAIGANLGAIVPLTMELTAGISARNIGTAGKGASLPGRLAAGADYCLPFWRVRAALDLGYGLVDDLLAVAAGVEAAPHQLLAVRLGYKHTLPSQGLQGLSGLTAGFGLKLGEIGLDYAFQPMGDLVTTHRVALFYARRRPAEQPVLDAGMKPKTAFDPAREYQAATELYAAGDYAGAVTRAGNAVTVDPALWQAWQVVGNCRYAQGDRPGALEAYKRSLAINSSNPQLGGFIAQLEAQIQAGTPAPAAPGELDYQGSVAQYGAGDYAGALAKASAAVQSNQNYWQAWQMVGNCRYALGDKPGAIEAYQHSLQLNPANDQLKGFLQQLTGQK